MCQECRIEKTKSGNIYHYDSNGEFHCLDGPAIERPDGSKFWYLHGQLYREDGPAVEWANGTKFWYLHGKYHRENGPAIEWTNGSKAWWLNDQYYPSKEKWEKALNVLKTQRIKGEII